MTLSDTMSARECLYNPCSSLFHLFHPDCVCILFTVTLSLVPPILVCLCLCHCLCPVIVTLSVSPTNPFFFLKKKKKCGRNTKTAHRPRADVTQNQHMAHVPLQSFGVDFSSVKTMEETRVVTPNTRTGTLQEQKHLTYVAHQLRFNCVLAVRAYNACQASMLV